MSWVICLHSECGSYVMDKTGEWVSFQSTPLVNADGVLLKPNDLMRFETNGAAKQYCRDQRIFSHVYLIPLTLHKHARRCGASAHPGTSRTGFQCVLERGHGGEHEFGEDYRRHKASHGRHV